ncbi:hypothetical protein ABZP36_009905 [Zizania latifolia]
MIGFAAASAGPGRAGGSFAAAFLGSFLGIIVLIFGNVSNIGALKAAGHLKGMEDEKRLGMEKGEGMSAVADSVMTLLIRCFAPWMHDDDIVVEKCAAT